jgi:uncharacterized protein (TIRG00374 family)
MKKNVILALRIAVGIGLIALIVWQAGGLAEIVRVLAGLHALATIGVLALDTVDRALMTYKWTRLLAARDVRLPFFEGMKIYCASMVWGTFLPTTVGSDAIRGAYAMRLGFNGNEVFASITIERLVGFISGLVLGLVGLAQLSQIHKLGPETEHIWLIAIFVLLAAILAFVISFSPRAFNLVHGQLLNPVREHWIARRLRQFHETYVDYQANKRALVQFFILTVIEQLFPIVEVTWIAWGMGIKVTMLQVFGVILLTKLLSRIPISINSLGVFEGIFVVLFALVGVGAAESVAISLVGRILQTLSWMPWWLGHVAQSGRARSLAQSQERIG